MALAGWRTSGGAASAPQAADDHRHHGDQVDLADQPWAIVTERPRCEEGEGEDRPAQRTLCGRPGCEKPRRLHWVAVDESGEMG